MANISLTLRLCVYTRLVNGSPPELFPAAYILKKWFSSVQSEKPRAFGLDAGEIFQLLEDEVTFIVKDLSIK